MSPHRDHESAGVHGALARWMYRDGRANGVASFLNRLWARAGAAGVWPERLVTAEMRGRRSGKLVSFPLVLARVDGERYLVSMLGEGSGWVANLRAAGGRMTLVHGDREAVRLEDVPVDRRAPILKEYLRVAPGARPHVPVDWRAPVDAFERVAAAYPVFRVRPDGPARQ